MNWNNISNLNTSQKTDKTWNYELKIKINKSQAIYKVTKVLRMNLIRHLISPLFLRISIPRLLPFFKDSINRRLIQQTRFLKLIYRMLKLTLAWNEDYINSLIIIGKLCKYYFIWSLRCRCTADQRSAALIFGFRIFWVDLWAPPNKILLRMHPPACW